MNKTIAKCLLEELKDHELSSIIHISGATAMLWFDWFIIDRGWSNKSIELSRSGSVTDEEYWEFQREHVEKLKNFLSEKT